MRPLLLALAFTLGAPFTAISQTPSRPATFRLVTPKGPGSITIDMEGWTIKSLSLYDHGTRAIFFLKNNASDLFASYILSNNETFDFNVESCKNETLGLMIRDTFKHATLQNKRNTSQVLPSGQTLDMASFLLLKDKGVTLNQQNVFGFIGRNHTCAEIHLSHMPFKAGDEHLFAAALDGFQFNPAYVPVASDYRAMATLLPRDMASSYQQGSGTKLRAREDGNQGQYLDFALPGLPGHAHMDAPNFVVTELSAKPNGQEFGVRARDYDITGAEVLGFLFVPDPSQPTAVACRNWMLDTEKNGGVKNRKVLKTYESTSDSGVPLAMVDYEQTKAPPSSRFARRFFAVSSNLCLDVLITAATPMMIDGSTDILFKGLIFDASLAPAFPTLFRYASVISNHHNPAAAAPLYEKALALVDSTADPLRWRRLVTDQLSLSYGMSGDLKRSREVNEAAILKDPTYPLYYYNLACADAESGDATAARVHLQQASDRRANTLKGEPFPDPSTDDSILTLKDNKAFWAFVQSLPKT